MHLRRELSLFDTVLIGVGIIVGAGIYSLIGEGIRLAGPAIWISFLIAGIMCILFLNFGTMVSIAQTANFSAMLVFLMINASSLITRHRDGTSIVVPFLGCIATIWLMFSFGIGPVIFAAAMASLGYFMYYLYNNELPAYSRKMMSFMKFPK